MPSDLSRFFFRLETVQSQDVATVTETQPETAVGVTVSETAPTAETISSIVNATVAQAIQEQELGGGHLAELLRELENSDNVELDLDDARIVFGATEIAVGEVVRGDLVILGGELAVKGEVTGDVVSFGGDVRLFRGAHIGGDVVSIDGVVTGSQSLVDGIVRAIDSPFDLPAPRQFARFDFEPNVSAPVAIGGGIMTLLATLVAFSSIGFGLTFFAPKQLNIIAARGKRKPRQILHGWFIRSTFDPPRPRNACRWTGRFDSGNNPDPVCTHSCSDRDWRDGTCRVPRCRQLTRSKARPTKGTTARQRGEYESVRSHRERSGNRDGSLVTSNTIELGPNCRYTDGSSCSPVHMGCSDRRIRSGSDHQGRFRGTIAMAQTSQYQHGNEHDNPLFRS